MVELKDTASLRGVFTMKVYKDGGKNRKLIETFEDHNLIVNLARVSMAHLIAGDTANRSMQSIAFGTNGTAPTVDDTDITSPFVKNLGGVTYPQVGQARFSWTLSTSEANGKAIMEFGLLTADGKLFCRRTRSTPINKESDISLEGTWTIIF
jgi:hypothetical protein